MEADIAKLVLEMKDRQDIYDCMMRFCRGVDRLDRDMLLSAYHPDAVDDHGAYVGPAAGFADFVFGLYETHKHRTSHHVTNHHCEISGESAHAETYYYVESFYTFPSVVRTPSLHMTSSGRYIDRLEKRDGRWAIAVRVCIVDIRHDNWLPAGDNAAQKSDFMSAHRNRQDPSYLRPLTIDPSRLTARS